jgi:hypothetical protein
MLLPIAIYSNFLPYVKFISFYSFFSLIEDLSPNRIPFYFYSKIPNG